jgi:cell division protein ZapD
VILYEYPFNERIRTYLRLEQLFRRLGELVLRDAALDHHFALATIFEIMDVAARADLKSDVLKDLKSRSPHWTATAATLDFRADARWRDRPDRCRFRALNSQPGKAGQSLTENEWLMSIRSRIGIPGGTCGFDLPAYYAWQHGDPATRRHDLEAWAGTLGPLAESIFLLLAAARFGLAAESGGRARPVPADPAAGRSFQLLRLRMTRPGAGARNQRQPPAGVGAPDAPGRGRRLQASGEDASFELALCA